MSIQDQEHIFQTTLIEYGRVDTRISTAWHINHWLKMCCSFTWARTIIRCFHETVPQGFLRCKKPRILSQIPKNFCIVQGNITTNIFKHFQWFSITRKIEEFSCEFCCFNDFIAFYSCSFDCWYLTLSCVFYADQCPTDQQRKLHN